MTATFRDLALRDEILRAVDEAGYTNPTPIQAQGIPVILARRDLVGIAQTGTGKTAAFVLPMIQLLSAGRARARMPRSLILSPTRELATQTADNFEAYGKCLKLSMALLIGGVSMGDQEKALERGVDVLIATPGRLLDWFERGKVMLTGVEILVIDEADRMLDMGFIPDIERIAGLLPRRQQTLLFSATMPKEIRRLADQFLTSPVEITVARSKELDPKVEDYLAVVPATRKLRALQRLIHEQSIDKAIVFCNRKRDVSTLNRQLKKAGLNTSDIHGDLEQRHRQATLDAFKRGEIDYLIATDVAARGLDVEDMPCVINYDVPMHAEDYVHRIGRTGRAGRKGRAFTLAAPEDNRYVGAISQLIGRDIAPVEIGGIEVAALDEEAPRRGRRAAPAAERKPRTSRAKAEAPVESAPEAAEAAAEPAKPGRRRRAKASEAPAPEAAPEPAAEAVAETPAPKRRRSRAKAAEAPAEAAEQPTEAAAEEAPRPARRRTRKRKAPEAPTEAAEAPVEAAPVEVPAEPEPVDPPASEPEAAPAPERAAPEERAAKRGRRGQSRGGGKREDRAPERRRREDEPVIGLGDHVPAFLLRPVPVRQDVGAGED